MKRDIVGIVLSCQSNLNNSKTYNENENKYYNLFLHNSRASATNDKCIGPEYRIKIFDNDEWKFDGLYESSENEHSE